MFRPPLFRPIINTFVNGSSVGAGPVSALFSSSTNVIPFTNVDELSLVPFPNSPLPFCPHDHTVPSFAKANTCDEPCDIDTILSKSTSSVVTFPSSSVISICFCTYTGTPEFPAIPFPICPLSFSPQLTTFPS